MTLATFALVAVCEEAVLEEDNVYTLTDEEKLDESRHDHNSDEIPSIHDFMIYMKEEIGHEHAGFHDPHTMSSYVRHARFVEQRAKTRQVGRWLRSLPGMCSVGGVLALLIALLFRCLVKSSVSKSVCMPSTGGMFKAGPARKAAKKD